MITDIDAWMGELFAGLRDHFGPRLLFFGLQGSYNRGEAGPDSDIDVVTVMADLSVPDLAAYRQTVQAMPEGDKACGFICGRDDLDAWPGYEVFLLAQDTRPFHGSLDDIAVWTPDDVRECVAIGASALYHQCCHSYLYGTLENRPVVLAGLCKSAFFLARAYHAYAGGRSVLSLSELEREASLREREILHMVRNRNVLSEEWERNPDPVFQALLTWCSDLLRETKA